MAKVLPAGHSGIRVMEKQNRKHRGHDPPGKVGKVLFLIQGNPNPSTPLTSGPSHAFSLDLEQGSILNPEIPQDSTSL